MINFENLLDKQLLDRTTATNYGKIVNLSLDQGRAILHTDTHTVMADKICNIAEMVICTNCVVVDSNQPLLGKQCYTAKGIPLGKIEKLHLTTTLKVRNLSTASHTFTVGKILCVGDVVLTKHLTAQHNNTNTTPIQYGNCDWVLGRICYKNITNYNNEIIVHIGDLVTRSTIQQCKSACKLRELIVNSK